MNKDDIRQHITEKTKAGALEEAIQLLQRYASGSLTVSEANYVVGQLGTLQPAISLPGCRIAIVRSFTVEPLVPLLTAKCFAAGLDAEIHLGDFGTYAQDFLDSNSNLYSFEPDIVFVAIRTSDIMPELWHYSLCDNAQDIVRQTLEALSKWLEIFRTRSQASIIMQNFELPHYPTNGVLDSQQIESQYDIIRQTNTEIKKLASNMTGVYVLDYDSLIARHGRLNWHDERKWLTMRMPVAASYIPTLADEYMRYIYPLMGKICKAVVFDLDNTLWGGVIGEDGMEGIKVGPEYPDAAYLALQRIALNLYNRGILLAICSKNNPDDALEALENHPQMLLRSRHIAAMRINWIDKAENLRQIAKELNIGTESLVFVDDNPTEREWVALNLPEVTVVDLPADPMNYAQALQDIPMFERLLLLEEDVKRSRYYVEQRQRDAAQKAAVSLEEFYASLQMEAQIILPSEATIPRIAQLTQKTNQFNLTTRRYSEQEITQMSIDPDTDVYAIRVTDRFGDNGIVGVSILRHSEGIVGEIDTFLLSCRVIGRTVETAFLSHVVQSAEVQRMSQITAWYFPTKKNLPARDFYQKHGFACIKTEDNGASLWSIDLSQDQIDSPPWISFVV